MNHPYIVIDDSGDVAACLDSILKHLVEESALDSNAVRRKYSTTRDGDSRAWLVRFVLDDWAELADGVQQAVDPDLLDQTCEDDEFSDAWDPEDED